MKSLFVRSAMNGNTQCAVLIHLMLFSEQFRKTFFAAFGGVAAAPAPTTHCGPAPPHNARAPFL